MAVLRAYQGDCRWDGVTVHPYKSDGGTSFKDVTRQNLFDEPVLDFQWRYFEVAPGGYSTLERHVHAHAVMIVRGCGAVLVGNEVLPIHLYDLVYVPPLTWHQFQPTGDEPLGFLCTVNAKRDRPQLPTPSDLDELRAEADVAAFIKV